MATLATFWKRSDAVAVAGSGTVRASQDPYALRALPGDSVYFYAKKIDNSRLVRQADPASRAECLSTVGAVAVLLALGASIVAPRVASVSAGYTLEGLKDERQSLLDQRRALQVQEASLLSPERLHVLAAERNMASPASAQVFHLDGQQSGGSMAANSVPQLPGSVR